MAHPATILPDAPSGLAEEDSLNASLRRIERCMSFAIMALYGVLALAVGWILFGPVTDLSTTFSTSVHSLADLVQVRFWLLLAVLPSIGLTLVTAFQTRKLFGSFGRGIILDARNATTLKMIARLLLASVPVNILTHTLGVLALTSGNPAGQKQLVISFKSFDLTVICFGLFVLAFAHVIGEGARLADENHSFV